MINPSLVIPEQFRRTPGDLARHPRRTRSINARPADEQVQPSKEMHNRTSAEQAALKAEASRTDKS